MKLVGISMVRNEADIVDLTIRHHLRLGCDSVLVVDNGSTDRTVAVLRRLAKSDRRIKWTRDPGPLRQSEIMTTLAREAYRVGAEWIVPFDADEFWWCRPDKTLTTFLDGAGDVAVVQAPVVNFVQHRRCQRSSRRALLHMKMRAVPVPPAEDAQKMVTAREIAFVEIVYPPKTVFRAGSEVALVTGNHAVIDAPGPSTVTGDLACLHAPLRSKRVLEAQVEHGRRLAEVSSDPGLGWHVRRWHQLWSDGDFGGEWPANSYLGSTLDVYGQHHHVEPDERLCSAVRAVLWRHPIR